MIKVDFYTKYDSISSFKITEIELKDISTNSFWIKKFSKTLIVDNNYMTDLITGIKSNPDIWSNMQHCSRNISKHSNTLEGLYSSEYKEVFIIEKSKEKYDVYISEKEYRILKQEYILDTFFLNDNISQNPELRTITESYLVENKKLVEHQPLTEEDINWLEMFNHDNQSLKHYYIRNQIQKYLKYEDSNIIYNDYITNARLFFETLVIEDDLHIRDTNFKLTFDNITVHKINSFFPKPIRNTMDSFGLYIHLKDIGLEFYFEPYVGNNNLCIVQIDDQPLESHFSFNCSLETFLLFVLFNRDNLSSFTDEKKEDFHYPQLNFLDNENAEEVFQHLEKNMNMEWDTKY